MSYVLNGQYHRMPITFGPTMGPRQVPDGVRINDGVTHRKSTATVVFEAAAAQLERHLPPRFALRGTPRVMFELSFMTEIEWLAGRGYNLCGVKIPVVFDGKAGAIPGMFYSVLWESLTDPILSGRDELGVPKLYAEIPSPRIYDGHRAYEASWFNFAFFQLDLFDLEERTGRPVQRDTENRGNLQWKYVPRTGAPGEADVSLITFTPIEDPNLKIERHWRGQARARFNRASWEQLPTMYHVVNALADIQLGPLVSATLVESRGFKDLGDTRVVE